MERKGYVSRPYNRVRANIRNALVGLSVAEVQKFTSGAIERGDYDAVEYAGEWLRELEAEIAEFVDPSECSGDHYRLACTD